MIALLFAFLPFVLVFLLIVYAFLWGITHLKWIIMGFVLVLGAVATCSYSRADMAPGILNITTTNVDRLNSG